MAYLKINGKELEGKCSFKFDRVADEKYNSTDEKGQKMGGFVNIYLGLLAKDVQRLSAFWDCATAHYKTDKPAIDIVEDVLEERIEEEGTEVLFKEAFSLIDEAGFYATKRNEFWKGLESLKAAGKTAEEKKTNLQIHEAMTESRAALKA